jgi:hypothetical protein
MLLLLKLTLLLLLLLLLRLLHGSSSALLTLRLSVRICGTALRMYATRLPSSPCWKASAVHGDRLQRNTCAGVQLM